METKYIALLATTDQAAISGWSKRKDLRESMKKKGYIKSWIFVEFHSEERLDKGNRDEERWVWFAIVRNESMARV